MEIWGRCKGESQPAFDAFKIYLSSADRKLTSVAAQCSKNISLIKRWASKFDWHERAVAFDNSIIEQARQAAADGLADMIKRQVTAGKFFQSKAIEALTAKDVTKASFRSLIEMARLGFELERAARELDAKNQAADDKEITINIVSARRLAGEISRRAEGGDSND